mmetsp:Transcript_89511/g.134200  ORF Transcript_89511/g.134200 Transcript_89511/m.134200 type:complete len:94 (+) Transcript_89511:560-841(+)
MQRDVHKDSRKIDGRASEHMYGQPILRFAVFLVGDHFQVAFDIVPRFSPTQFVFVPVVIYKIPDKEIEWKLSSGVFDIQGIFVVPYELFDTSR